MRIGFIGGGNMARSLIGGLRHQGHPGEQIFVSDPDNDKLAAMRSEFALQCCQCNKELVANSDAIVLAVKPQLFDEVLSLLKDCDFSDKVVISIAAGITTGRIVAHLGEKTAIVRTMPNTPALVGEGATGLFALPSVSAEQKETAEYVMKAAGMTLWVDDETDLDRITAISGSGPAYFFLFIEALEEAARKLGLPAEQASQLARQTALGAAKMTLQQGADVTTLRTNVMSKGGTTECAIHTFEHGNLRELVDDAVQACFKRARELAEG